MNDNNPGLRYARTPASLPASCWTTGGPSVPTYLLSTTNDTSTTAVGIDLHDSTGLLRPALPLRSEVFAQLLPRHAVDHIRLRRPRPAGHVDAVFDQF